MPPQASDDLYRTLQRLQVFLVSTGRRAWGRMGTEFDPAWQQVAPALVAVTSAVQERAAEAATSYVPAVLAETGQPDEPLASVRPQAFAGVASDGRDLSSLLEGSTRLAKAAVGSGATPAQGLALGGRWLEGTLQTIATDAARDAIQAEIITRRNMGYVRMINPPCCSRCAVLAGRWYSHGKVFQRHPRCDCTMIPALENRADDFRVSADALYKRGLITDITAAQRARLEDGANLNRVLNESRDRWRERMAAERRATRGKRSMWAETAATPPLGTALPDIMARLTASVDAERAARLLRSAGIAE